ncbi:FIP1[III]-like protein isoform X2 [Cajanus cajan]|uniref:FIP1[III]-like protein isoform X2 n=1 Tax=Cajanus cajan TaxID=3821 RepID=UPI00098DA74E|nr:FIP1[III]-like protein isoform X2 [Cajanus cajan]
MEGFDDDDFGELYAVDIELPNTIQEEEEEVKPDVNTNIANLHQDKNNDAVNDCDDCAAASDSDDDDDDDALKIVLNDEDVPAGVVGCDDDGDADEGDDNGSRYFHPKCGRGRRLAFEKNMEAAFENNMKVNAAMGMASYISSLNRRRRNGDTVVQNLGLNSSRVCLAANPMFVQCGYASVLPWSWGIFDVNIDTLTEKPWKIPGVDMTDYFNFGFNESTWKLYCASLEQLWKTSLQTGISVDDSAKWNQEAMREQTDQVVSGNVLFPSSDFGLPKGRAIQVENSMVERQPSIDVRRPRNRDFNVIEIKLLESSDDYSGSGHSIVMDALLEGESMSGNKQSIHNSSGEQDELLSEDQLEDVKKAEDASVQKRSGPIPGANGDEHRDQVDQHSEDTAQVPEGEINAEEGGGIDAFNSNSCWIESELSLGDQEHSLTSYTDSDSEGTENSVHVDNDKNLSPLRRKSLNFVTEMKESLPLYCKNMKNSVNKKAVNVAYNSRTRGQFRKEQRHQSSGYEPGYNRNKHTENNNDVSLLLKSSSRDLSLLARQFVDYDRHEDQLEDFGSHKRDVSYNREKQSYYYGGEKVVDVVTRHSRYYHEDRESFRENTNRCNRRNGDVGNYFFEQGPQFADSEDREKDWYHPGCGYSADDLSNHSYRESRWSLPKHSSFPDKEMDTQRKRMDEKFHFMDRNFIDDFDECEFEFLHKRYRMSTSAAEREMELFDNNGEEQFAHIDRDWRRSVRRGRHLASGIVEDNCQKYTRYQTSNFKHRRQSYTDSVKNYAYDARVNVIFGGCGRDKHARDNRGCNQLCDYTDTAEDEDLPIYPEEEYRFYRSPSKFLNWTEDEIICRHHETHASSLSAKVQSDDMPLQWHQLCMSKRDSERYFKDSSKIMCRSKGGQAVLRFRKSVDLINGEGKSRVRRSRVLCNGRLENVNQRIAKKRRASVVFDESHKKASKFDTSKHQSNQESKKWLQIQNLSDQGQKESSDIEEGQIVTEEPYMDSSVSRRDASEGSSLTDSVKKKMSQNDQFIGGYDSQRILDSLAKMEKRRERFKQPITVKRETEESLKVNNDSIVDTGEMKQHRPARKRRWVGN